MKKLLYIFLTLSILSIGCSNDDDSVQPTNTTLSLDNNLIGEWYVEDWDGGWSWTLVFFSNGEYHEYYVDGPNSSDHHGDWYVENQLLYFSDWGYLIEYNISGNSLTLTELDGDPIGILTKQ